MTTSGHQFQRDRQGPMSSKVAKKTHSIYSASGAEIWVNCPGSVSLSEKAPEQVDGPYAEEGTRAHEVFEYVLKYPKKDPRAKFKNKKLYPTDMLEHCEQCAVTVQKYRPKVAHEFLVERKVDLKWIDKDFGGTLDVTILVEFGILYIIDFKYGAGIPVDPEDNLQLISYALAVAHEYDYSFTKVILLVVQPRAEHVDGPIRRWETNCKTLKEYAVKFKKAIAETKKKDAALIPGDHCRWCKAKSICTAISSKAVATIAPKAVKSIEAMLPQAGSIDAKKLPEVLDACSHLEKWIKEVRKQSFELVLSGKKISGWKMVAKRGRRAWLDEEKVIKDAKISFASRAFDVKLKSPAQLEKIAGKPWVKKRAAMKVGGVTLVPESDSREEFNVLDAEFDDLTTDEGEE